MEKKKILAAIYNGALHAWQNVLAIGESTKKKKQYKVYCDFNFKLHPWAQSKADMRSRKCHSRSGHSESHGKILTDPNLLIWQTVQRDLSNDAGFSSWISIISSCSVVTFYFLHKLHKTFHVIQESAPNRCQWLCCSRKSACRFPPLLRPLFN